MTSFFQRVYDGYNYINEDLADPRAKNLLFASSPFPILGVAILYHLFVFKIGPRFMKNRKPYNLDKIMIVYNALQIVACFYMVVEGVTKYLFTHSMLCEPVDYSNTDEAIATVRHVWMYFMLKIIDLLDTVFIILRKKDKQISFLHLYHHTGMLILGYSSTKYAAGGHCVRVGLYNNIVHVIMYFYYLVTALNKEQKKNVWWKKYLTQLQILQFCLITIHYTQLFFVPNCNYPTWVSWVFVPQNILMIYLFTDFYIKNYVKPQAKPKSDKQNATTSNGIDTDMKKES